MQLGAPFLLAFAAALVLVPLCRLCALRLGFVAKPREDRWHTRPIALLGGVAIGMSVLVAMVVFGHNEFTATPFSANSADIPSVHMLMPYFAIV